jgi:hypothetical protein
LVCHRASLTKQDHSANLDLWAVVVPSSFQPSSDNLTNWSAIAPSSKQNASGNLTSWSAIAPSAKQDASANLTSWSALAPSAKQDASANLTSWSALAPSAKQDHSSGLDFWSAVTGIDPATLQVTSGTLAVIGGPGGGVTLNQVSNVVTGMTIPLDSLAPQTGVNIFGVDSSTNQEQIVIGNNLSLTSIGPGTNRLDAAASGGSASAHLFTNVVTSATNVFIIDPLKASSYSIGLITNTWLRVSNVYAFTNLPLEMPIWIHQDTNKGFNLLGFDVVGGLLKTNMSIPFVLNTNIGSESLFTLRQDWTGTNVFANMIATNVGPHTAMTNTSATGGGGGGGGSGLFPSDSIVVNLLLNNSAADSSGNGNDFTYHGSAATYVADESGTASHALRFNGTDEYIDAPNTTVANFTSGNFSIVTYLTNTISDFSGSPFLWGNTVFGSPGYYMFQHLAFGGDSLAAELQFAWNDNTGDHTIASNDRDIVPNVNYCVVFVRNGTSGKIYVNGVDQTQAGQPTIGTINSSSSKFTLGKYLGNSNFLPGKVQQLIIYSRALTPTEVATGSGGTSQ